jgi:hypothetical protein
MWFGGFWVNESIFGVFWSFVWFDVAKVGVTHSGSQTQNLQSLPALDLMPVCRRSRSSAFDDETIFPSSFSCFPVLVSLHTPLIKRKTPDRFCGNPFQDRTLPRIAGFVPHK